MSEPNFRALRSALKAAQKLEWPELSWLMQHLGEVELPAAAQAWSDRMDRATPTKGE